ncbi:hypothetical protein BC361_08820 [Ensifer sp. LC54]|nr:hypothetical protein BC361_08820 [Ensifer sp. LC54]OCP28556.1 hypothetical protein BC363_01540 [Ensifer sp. LC384]
MRNLGLVYYSSEGQFDSMRKYFLSGLKLMLLVEKKYGRLSLVVWPLLSMASYVVCMKFAHLLYDEYGFALFGAKIVMILIFSPAIMVFYTSFMLLSDELFSFMTGRTFYGKEPGSLRKRLQRMAGI